METAHNTMNNEYYDKATCICLVGRNTVSYDQILFFITKNFQGGGQRLNELSPGLELRAQRR